MSETGSMCIVAFAWHVLDDIPTCPVSKPWWVLSSSQCSLHQWENRPMWQGRIYSQVEHGWAWPQQVAGRCDQLPQWSGQNQYSTSRGHLIQDFLESDLLPSALHTCWNKSSRDYAGFNLFLGDREQAVYMSNRGEAPQVLANGSMWCPMV